MLSLRARIIRFLTKLSTTKHPPGTAVEKRREGMEALRRLPLEKSATYTRDVIAEIPCEWVDVPHNNKNEVTLFLHGGGFCVGSSSLYRCLTSHLAAATQTRVLALDYRLAPEHPFPAGLEDALVVYRYLLLDFGAKRIALVGDSAGGGLVLSLLLQLRDLGVEQPAGAVLISPWTDLTGSGNSILKRAEHDPILSWRELDEFAEMYVPHGQRKNPLVSPVFADFHDLPPLLVQVGDDEILLSDALRVGRKAKSQGVKTTLDIWPDMWHVWHLTTGWVPEGKRAMMEIGDFVRRQLRMNFGVK